MNSLIPLEKVVNYSDKRLATLKERGILYVTTDNMLPDKEGITYSGEYPNYSNSIPVFSKNNILIGNIRPYLKKIWFAGRNGYCSSDVLVLDVKEDFDPKFVYYAIFKDDFFEHMMRGSKGTKMPRGDKDQIMEYVIPDLKLPIQNKIASLLSSIDNKINLNKQVSKRIDHLSNLLFDYWFIQCDFPNENRMPYKSNGGKMNFNKDLNRPIPFNWSSGNLIDIANITMGQSPPGDSYTEDGEAEILLQGCTDFGNRYPLVRQFTTQSSRHAEVGDILLSVRAPVGEMNIANNRCCIGRGVAALNSKQHSNAFLYGVMKYFKQIFERRNVDGTTFGAITKDDLFTLNELIPPYLRAWLLAKNQ